MNEYRLENALIIVAGDCGFGFYRRGYYDNMIQKYHKRLAKSNNYVLFVRGNHDNPTYFTGDVINTKRIKCIPDYSKVTAAGHTILCIGGGLSIDRTIRLRERNNTADHYNGEERFKPAYYWPDEMPVFDEDYLETIKEDGIRPDTIITHTAPSWCELSDKGGIFLEMMREDDKLEEDNKIERGTMDQIHDWLQCHDMRPERWIYGHFHRSWHGVIHDIAYSLLDCVEFKMLY
jgi:UDP-2,3-diacylglucosamine pyrophosphatase LpxH